eukprot:CAMPEP_0196571818 /NCGR_PEP_ID=MMETSP1081-20130531/1954_1 /TAXON_ID=36882 /ORGANISM="Pyramimonas amylifera, Strain CCMP720" /LENGTH=215 /DNA_ID=CAMNT_0041888915 /DNA_START=90 /DNA_END=737 /DNA_ORIENTATION=-
MTKSLLLTSAGLTTEPIRAAFKQLLEKRDTPPGERIAVYIPDAAIADGADMRPLADDMRKGLKNFGVGEMRMLELAKSSQMSISEALKDADVVYAEYGNTFFLQYQFQKSGFASIFPPLAESGMIYVGSSAGSIAAGPTAGIALWKGWDNPNVVPYDDPPDYTGLNLTKGVSIFPHYSDQWKSLVEQKRTTIDHEVVTLTDFQAYLVEGDRGRVV